jgi:hypothetical protein
MYQKIAAKRRRSFVASTVVKSGGFNLVVENKQ